MLLGNVDSSELYNKNMILDFFNNNKLLLEKLSIENKINILNEIPFKDLLKIYNNVIENIYTNQERYILYLYQENVYLYNIFKSIKNDKLQSLLKENIYDIMKNSNLIIINEMFYELNNNYFKLKYYHELIEILPYNILKHKYVTTLYKNKKYNKDTIKFLDYYSPYMPKEFNDNLTDLKIYLVE